MTTFAQNSTRLESELRLLKRDIFNGFLLIVKGIKHTLWRQSKTQYLTK